MIVLLRGTSGSGKTYIAQQVIKRLGGLDKAYHIKFGPPDRLVEKWRVGAYAWTEPAITLMGRYDATCGGCDTISWPGAADATEKLMLAEAARGQHVLFEGLMVSCWGIDRLKRMDKAAGLTVVYLNTPLENCIASVKARRNAREQETFSRYRARVEARDAKRIAEGKRPLKAPKPPKPLKPFDEENTRSKHHTLTVTNENNRLAGIKVEILDRPDALARTMELLEICEQSSLVT